MIQHTYARRRHAPSKHETQNKLFPCSTKTSFWSFGFWCVWFQILEGLVYSAFQQQLRRRKMKTPSASSLPLSCSNFHFPASVFIATKVLSGSSKLSGCSSVYLLPTTFGRNYKDRLVLILMFKRSLYFRPRAFFFFRSWTVISVRDDSWILERLYHVQAYIQQTQVAYSDRNIPGTCLLLLYRNPVSLILIAVCTLASVFTLYEYTQRRARRRFDVDVWLMFGYDMYVFIFLRNTKASRCFVCRRHPTWKLRDLSSFRSTKQNDVSEQQKDDVSTYGNAGRMVIVS